MVSGEVSAEKRAATLADEGDISDEIARIQRRLADLDAERAALVHELETLEQKLISDRHAGERTASADAPVTNNSSSAEKVELFRRLFAGRPDVFPMRWENRKTGRSGYSPACSNEWAKGICGKPKVKCGECPHQAFIPPSEDIIEKHLRGGDGRSGDFVAGVYPLLQDETCWFLAADFDKESWADDARALRDTCHAKGIAAALERSRSGNGGHVWIFFSEPVPAKTARLIGSALITETMEKRPEIGFASYDRLFPNQDTMPLGGFGNLIALPLQRKAREVGNSVFVDNDLRPYDDQWAYLSSLPRLSADMAYRIADEAELSGRVLGVRMPVDDEHADEPWKMSPSRRSAPRRIEAAIPHSIRIVVADQVYIDRTGPPAGPDRTVYSSGGLPEPGVLSRPGHAVADIRQTSGCLVRRALRAACRLPRGCLEEAIDLIKSLAPLPLGRSREIGATLPDVLPGELRPPQLGRSTPSSRTTTVCLPRQLPLARRLSRRRSSRTAPGTRSSSSIDGSCSINGWSVYDFFEIDPKQIGVIGGRNRKPTGVIDVAVIQSLVRKGEVADIVANYGHLVVDECHHLSAASFELVARRSKARYVVGLSATVARKDGHHPIIFMQCGPVRHRVDARVQAAERGIRHRVRDRSTQLNSRRRWRRPNGRRCQRYTRH